MGATPVRETPLITTAAVRARLGPVWLKLESVQRTGSFKLRGAVARLMSLSEEERARGVVAASAGNHGAGVALAASRLGIAATVVVPETTPMVKRRRMGALGAEVAVQGATYDQAEAVARERAAATGAVFVSPFDDEHVIAGNGGSLADEIVRQAAGQGELARVICPVGGGGLIGGLAARLAPRGVSVIGVQPRANCAMYESLQQGRALIEYDGAPTLAEGCEGAVAERTYELARAHVERIELVSEPAIRRAVAFCYRAAGAIVECTAAVAMAGLLEGAVEPASSGITVCVLTGSNIEPELLDEILAGEAS